MGTDAVSILATIALFIFGLWVLLAFTGLLLDILGVVLIGVAVIWFFRWLRSRGA